MNKRLDCLESEWCEKIVKDDDDDEDEKQY